MDFTKKEKEKKKYTCERQNDHVGATVNAALCSSKGPFGSAFLKK
jgi:hypothetical protein